MDDHPERSAAGFRNWLDLIKQEADEEDWGWLLPEQRLSFRHLNASPLRIRTEFSAGAEASSAIVQINEPTTAGSENPLSGIAADDDGVRYVVRQGTLHKNRVSPRIDIDEFQRLTRLAPVTMMVGDAPAKRRWFVVAQIDRVDAATVVAQTADFVDRCWAARLSHVEDATT